MKFYCVSTYDLNNQEKDMLLNRLYFQDKKNAINNIADLFKRCYPLGEQARISEFGNCIESPKYNDYECYLERFITVNEYMYELSTIETED